MPNVKPLSKLGGVVVEGIDLSKPLAEAEAAALRDAFEREGLLIVKGQSLSKQGLVDASYVFGEPEIHPLVNAIDREHPDLFEGKSRETWPRPPDDGITIGKSGEIGTELFHAPTELEGGGEGASRLERGRRWRIDGLAAIAEIEIALVEMSRDFERLRTREAFEPARAFDEGDDIALRDGRDEVMGGELVEHRTPRSNGGAEGPSV